MDTLPWNRQQLIRELRRDLWRYLTPAASVEEELLEAAALLQATPGELRTLGRLQFLISDELGELLEQLPSLTRRLATTTASEEEWSMERIRGSIQWSRTISARNAIGNPHLYVTSPARRAFQTPENELLSTLLDAIVRLGRQTGWQRSQSADVGRLISSRVADAERWKQTRALLQVERRPMTPKKVSRVRSGRHRRRYQAVLDVYDRYRLLAERLDRTSIRSAVETYGLVSRDDPTLFELICTFRTIDALRSLGWKLSRLGLFAGSLELSGRKGLQRLILHYQRTPVVLSTNSAYRNSLSAHGVNPGLLRPDLVLTHIAEDGTPRWLMIEAKGGKRDAAESARQATFDLLAYRTAFAAALNGQPAPYGLGLVWGADQQPHHEPIMLATPDHLTEALDRFLSISPRES